jgi:predicted outer membrane repeat protein
MTVRANSLILPAMVVFCVFTCSVCESSFAGNIVSFGTDEYTVQPVGASIDFAGIADYGGGIGGLDSDGAGTAGFYYSLHDDEIAGEFWHVRWEYLEDDSTLIVCEGYLENIADYELKDVGLTIQFWHFYGMWSPPVFFEYNNSDHTWYLWSSWARTCGVMGQDTLLSMSRSKTDVPLSVTLQGVTGYIGETDEATLISFGDLSAGERVYRRVYAVASSPAYGWRGYVVSTSPHGPVNLNGLEIIGPNEVAENSSTRYSAIASYDNGSKTDVGNLAIWSIEPNGVGSIEAGLLQMGDIDEQQDATVYVEYTEGGVSLESQMAVKIYPHMACTLEVPSDYGTIQAAIDSAVDGDTVVVAPGTYTGAGNRDIDFYGKAIKVRCTEPNNPNVVAATIIDCNGTKEEPHRGFNFHSGENANSVLDGLTVTNGYAEQGGGTYCSNSSPTITNCIFRDNWAFHNGGGMHNSDGSGATVINCRFTGNKSSSVGGGIYCSESSPSIINCTISENYAYYVGGGISCFDNSNPTIVNCVISWNLAKGYFFTEGGGINCVGSSPMISNCIINDNSTQGHWTYGGGICCTEGSEPKVTRCMISGNRTMYGGGLYCEDSSAMVNNCLIRANLSKESGGGIYCTGEGDTVVTNCLITTNRARDKGGGICCFYGSDVVVTNSILWGDAAGKGSEIALRYSSYSSSITVSYSDVQGGFGGAFVDRGGVLNWGAGNIEADPCFAFSDDYHLASESPCVDGGTNDPEGGLLSEDLDGNARPLDGDGDKYAAADMGIYEFNAERPSIAVSTTDLEIFMPEGCTDFNDRLVCIRNCGGGKLKWELIEECAWLEIFPSSGTSSGEIDEVTFRVNAGGLAHGDYMCKVEVVDEQAVNSSRWIMVALHVNVILVVPEPYETIQAAIDAAVDGDSVVVADGTYTGDGNRDIDLSGKAITVRSESGAENCIIDCEGTQNEPHRGFILSNVKGVKSFLSGFTITNGDGYERGGAIFCSNASPTITDCIITGNAVQGEDAYGGGIYSEEFSNMTINGCIFTDNLVSQKGNDYYTALCGSGVYIKWGDLIVTGCTFSGNRIEGRQTNNGALHCSGGNSLIVSDCTVTSNSGGGIFFSLEGSATVRNCHIEGNSGYGIYCSSNLNATVRNCQSKGNSVGISCSSNLNATVNGCTVTGNWRRGISCYRNENATINNCSITHNSSEYSGGGIYFAEDSSTVTNSVIASNSADSYGGGIVCQGDSDNYYECRPTIRNCTIIANTAGNRGSALTCYNNSRPTITNCILWNNTSPDGIQILLMDTKYYPSPQLTVSYSDVEGGKTAVKVEVGTLNWGPGNIDVNPWVLEPPIPPIPPFPPFPLPPNSNREIDVDSLISNSVIGDYHLWQNSACINAGDPYYRAGPNETDMDGQPRVMGGRVDMGADEVVIGAMKLVPRALNPNSKGKWIKTHLVLPAGFTVGDVDTKRPAEIKALGIESDHMDVFINGDGLVEITAAFDRAIFSALTDYGPTDVTVIGWLTSGQYFYGTNTITIINNRFEYLAILSSYWLDGGCITPDWCNSFDIDRNSVVNFVDFAMYVQQFLN